MTKLALYAPFALLLLVGCGSEPPVSNMIQGVNEQPWRELKAKMDKMTPEQRTQYVKEHPEEFQNLGRIEAPAPTTPQ